jgi:hypothetical protein
MVELLNLWKNDLRNPPIYLPVAPPGTEFVALQNLRGQAVLYMKPFLFYGFVTFLFWLNGYPHDGSHWIHCKFR